MFCLQLFYIEMNNLIKIVLKRQHSNKRPNVFNIEISKFWCKRSFNKDDV